MGDSHLRPNVDERSERVGRLVLAWFRLRVEGTSVTQVATREDWKRVQPKLSERVGQDVFELYFRNTVILQLEPELVEIGVGSAMVAEYLSEKYQGAVVDSIEGTLGFKPGKVKFSINGHLFRRMREIQRNGGKVIDENGEVTESDAPVVTAPEVEAAKSPTPSTSRIFNINERFKLDSFIVGPNNKLAFNAAVEVANTKAGEKYPTLFIYGSTGTGKTHLLQGIALQLEAMRPNAKTLYITGEYFCNQFFSAMRAKSFEAFRQKFRSVDVLIIDDVHFVAGKTKCQEELLYTLKALEALGRQVVLSAPQHPKELEDVSDDLLSRFVQGMIAELKVPGVQTRISIIKSKLGNLRNRFPETTVQLLASRLECSIRELEGHLTQLVHIASMNENTKITVALVEEALKDLLAGKIRLVELGDIENVVIAHYCVTSDQIHGTSRQRTVAMARQVCMYLARRLTSHSLKEIGRYFGGKNHTTVVFAAQKIERALTGKPELKGTIERLERQLNDR